MASELPIAVSGLALPGVLLLTPRIWRDDRGFFVETYNERIFKECGIATEFVQDNLSRSKKGVLRGLHMQKAPHSQAKVVRCAAGEILDVVVDYDKNSATFGRHVAVLLRADTAQMLYIPAHYAHGFCVMSDEAVVEYKVSDYYHPESATGVRFDDPAFSIPWPITDPVLSEQDRQWPLIESV